MELKRYAVVTEHPTLGFATFNFKSSSPDNAIRVARGRADGADWSRLYEEGDDERPAWTKFHIYGKEG